MSEPTEILAVSLPVADGVPSPDATGVRRMTATDIPQLVELWLASYPPRITDATTRAEVVADWGAAFAGDYGRLLGEASLVVERDGRVIAAVQTVLDAIWAGSPRGPFVIEVITHPEARGRGLARLLVTEALAALLSSGFTTAALRVEKSNTAAEALYRSLGFAEIPTVAN